MQGRIIQTNTIGSRDTWDGWSRVSFQLLTSAWREGWKNPRIYFQVACVYGGYGDNDDEDEDDDGDDDDDDDIDLEDD